MVLDAGQLQEARLAEIQGSNSLGGRAGLQGRINQVREARRTFWAMAILGVLIPPIFAGATYPATPPLDFILAVEGAIALMLLMEVWIGLGAYALFARDTFYTNRIPARAMWDSAEMGKFPTSDVARVLVRSSKVADLDWLDVLVLSRSGQEARFSGFTRAAMIAEADRKGALLNPKAKADLMSHGGGAEDILKWARLNNVPITMEADPTRAAQRSN